jgi:hypothetical protein
MLAFYGPLLLFLLLAVWAFCLILGFGLMLHATDGAGLFADQQGTSFGESIYMSGSTFFTLGLGDVAPVSPAARALTVLQAGSGFGFLAVVIGYLPIFYQAFARREIAISLLDARAGSPPSALQLIRRNGERVTSQILLEWESWAAELLESHLSHPVLALFRSQHEKQSWLAALTVILDTCALIMTGIDRLPPEQARFTYAVARHALVDLAQVFFAEPCTSETERLSHEDFAALSDLLLSYCFPLKGLKAEESLAGFRKGYEPIADALSGRLLMDLPPWLPSEDAVDDWQTSPWDVLPPLT